MSRPFALLLVALLGCVDQPTQVLVRLATDIPDLDTVVISIYDDEDTLVREQVLPPDRLREVPNDGRFHPIGTFGLVPQDDDPNRRFRVIIDVAVNRDGPVRFETRARSGFVENNTIRLDIFIAELCIELAAMCEEEGLTCGIDGCVPEDVPPESLPPIDDDPIPDDPIDPRRFDGGVDAGMDAPGVDAPGVDSMIDAPGVDVPGVDGALDTGLDAPVGDAAFDAGADAGFDVGLPTLVPGDDDAPILFPWSGFRFEGYVPKIVFRAVPGAVQHYIKYNEYPSGGDIFEPVATAPIVEHDLMGITPMPGGRRLAISVLSCTGVDVFTCSDSSPVGLYIEVARVRCDLNNDGTSDPVVAESDGNVRAWVAGLGSAPSAFDAHTNTGTTVTACADLDGDGDAEVVSMQSVNGTVSVLDWSGSLERADTPFSDAATSMVAGDFDSDGFEDIVFADVNAGQVGYARGDAGTLLAPTSIPRHAGLAAAVADARGRYGRDLAVVDVNTDGYADVVITDANALADASKSDSGMQVCYGGAAPFSFCSFVPVPGPGGENFGNSVVGLGVSAMGHGGFAVGAPEAGASNTGGVYEYRSGATSPVFVAAPDRGDGICCFPDDLAPGVRSYRESTYVYYAGYGGYQTNRGRTYECGAGVCTTIAPPGSVPNAYFGFDVMGDLDNGRFVALGRSGAQNGVFVYGASWSTAAGFTSVDGLTRLAE